MIGGYTSNFKKTLQLVFEIDKHVNKSVAVIPASLKEVQKEAVKRLQRKERDQAEALIAQLLQDYQSLPEAQLYIQQIVQDIKMNYGLIDKNTSLVINIPPHPDNSEYVEHYNHSRYQALYPYCQLAYLSEQTGYPEEHALKLSLLFDDVSLSLKYITDNLNENALAVHDACLFVIPDVKQCDFVEWKKLIKNNINDMKNPFYLYQKDDEYSRLTEQKNVTIKNYNQQ